ncbi:ABC transporter permease [Ornithinibacillus contaminans]|uniref:ABC transporter permease n=1 Tax=Ornithinibacillus contaminans TaxID=694055 RepID=UPI00064DF570|nr:ABC transporter permease [Ornithinibacillus contaminans]
MIGLAWKRMKHRKINTIITLVAFISLFICIPFGLEQTKTSEVRVGESIENHGRGVYDLLVRPKDARSDVEEKIGMVEENYIGDSLGGISIEEWKEIQSDSDIEIAAPVASLGYFRGIQFSINLPVLDQPTRFTYQFFTSDGKSKFPLTSKDDVMYFEETGEGQIQYLQSNREFGSFSDSMYTRPVPENFNLVVGVDPQSEEALTGIDFSGLVDFEKNEVEEEANYQYYDYLDGDIPLIPILQRENLNVPLILDLKVETMDVNINDYYEVLGLSNGDFFMGVEDLSPAFNKLNEEEPINVKNMEIDLSQYIKPFDGEKLSLNKSLQIEKSDSGVFDIDTSSYFVASKINYENLDRTPTVEIHTDGSPPSYKMIEEKGVSLRGINGDTSKVPFLIAQVGTFQFSNQEDDHLTGSPLGIYGEMQAKAVDGTILTPTTIPGSFIPSPASGVTSIEYAELIKGEEPIDAIRIRLSGITSYNKEGKEKIEAFATKLLKMGYEVDVVAGSSFKEMELNVEGLGAVVEDWTTLGVAQKLSETWNIMTVITISLLSLFGVLWLVLRLIYEKNILNVENQLLSLIGWSKRMIILRNCMEQYLIITTAFLISIIVLVFNNAESALYWGATILWVIAILLTTIVLNIKTKHKNRVNGYKWFASLRYYKRFILPMISISLLSLVLISLQVTIIGDSYVVASETSLGRFISSESLWLQLGIVALVIYLSCISFSEGINTLFAERKNELDVYFKIGWTKRKVMTTLFKETGIWFLFSVVLSLIFSSIVVVFLSFSLVRFVISFGFSFIILSLILGFFIFTSKYVE